MTGPPSSPASLREQAPQAARAVDKRSKGWWLKMFAVSAGIVVVLLAAVAVTPVVRLHYYGWRWRNRRDEAALRKAVRMVGARGLSRDAVVRLLGKPDDDWPDEESDSVRWLHYDVEPKLSYSIKIENGQAVPHDSDRGGGSFCFVDPDVYWRRPAKNEDE